MPKLLLLGKNATNKSIIGINKLNDAVSVTLGAKGNTVIIGKHGGNAAAITKDGVTVSEAFELPDLVENLAATIVKQAAKKTAETAGDGTTTATILAHAMITEGLKEISKGANPMDLKRGIDEAVYIMGLHIKKLSQPVTPKTLKQVSIISANGDEFLGNLIAGAFEKVGLDGVLTIEESKTYETSVDIVAGMQVDKGYLSPDMVTDRALKICEFQNPFIVLIGQSVAMMKDILPVFTSIVNFLKENNQPVRPIIFIAENIKDEALFTLLVNQVKAMNSAGQGYPCCAIAAPSFGPLRNDLMQDIAVTTGATFISEINGIKLENATIEHVGSAAKVIVEEHRTLIFSGAGDGLAIENRKADLRKQIEATTDDRTKNTLKGRLARLANGVAVIKVGGATEIEVMEKKDRIDDAVCAINSASQEGYVVGGGTTYLHCSAVLNDVEGENYDQTLGIQIVKKALEAPFIKILTNAGILSDNAGWFSRRKTKKTIKNILSKDYGFGVNVKTDTFENLLEAGVIDPAKVGRCALENAASVAGIFLTTACILQDIPIK